MQIKTTLINISISFLFLLLPSVYNESRFHGIGDELFSHFHASQPEVSGQSVPALRVSDDFQMGYMNGNSVTGSCSYICLLPECPVWVMNKQTR